MCEKTVDSPIAILERWERHGGVWRTISLTAAGAAVELCTCSGEPADELRSTDAALLAYLTQRPRSDAGTVGVSGIESASRSAPTDPEEAGAASFPASDPPACWTWEVDRQPR